MEWTVSNAEINESLAAEFAQGPVLGDRGERLLTERTVGFIEGLKVEIFSKEHAPPHFRVKYGSDQANFQIDNCAKLNGGLERWLRTIQHWHSKHKAKLIEVWNQSRPSDCPVGEYREPK